MRGHDQARRRAIRHAPKGAQRDDRRSFFVRALLV